MALPQSKPNLIQRAQIAWNVFRRGFPVGRKASQQTAFAWPGWRENTPQWHITSFGSYVEEGFNLNSIIYSAIMYKVRSKMSAPLRAYTGDPGRPEPLPSDHPLSQLVTRPNAHQGWREFHALAEIYFNLGNCFILLVRPPRGGLPEKMYALRPDRVFIIPAEGGIKGYLYVPEGKAATDGLPVLPQDMMHIKLPNPLDPLEGMGYGLPPTAIAQSADVDNDITRFLKLFFQNGAMLLGILKFNIPLDDDEVAAVKRRWVEMYGGVDNWTEVGVLDQGGEYQRIGATFEEMGFSEVDERTESRILGPFGVPPILIGTRTGLNRSTFSNYREARQAYWEDTALPEMWLFEPEYQYHLSTDDGGFVAFDFSRVPALQKDVPKLVGAAWTMWKMGTPANMAFEAVGLRIPEIPGGGISYLPGNVLPVGIESSEEESMEGAPDAEEDERKSYRRKQGDDEEAEAEALAEQYQEELAALALLALAGDITRNEFEARLNELAETYLVALFLLGIGFDGEGDLSRGERAELDQEIDQARESAVNLAGDIYGERYLDEDGEQSLTERLALWVATALGAYALGQLWNPDDPKKMWVYGDTEHCDDCRRLHGQVHRASEWRASGWRPQSRDLECGGWRCQCRLITVPDVVPVSGSFSFTPAMIHKNGKHKEPA